MGLKRSTLERQLALAVEQQDARRKRLEGDGADERAVKRDAEYRQLAANARRIRSRLQAVAGVEQREADAAARKAEAASAE